MHFYNHAVKHGNSLIRILLAAGLSLSLIACGGSGTVAGTTTTSTSSSSTGSSSNGSSGGTATGTGTLNLQWTAPVSRTNGTPLSLSEIAGYRVHYGTSPGNFPNHFNITDGSLQSVVLTGLPVGTYYVAMSTYDTSGAESAYSPQVIKKAL